MKKFVPLKKQSKAAQQTYHSRQRAGWGCVNPAARVEKDRHQYDRKQSKTLLRKLSSKEDFFCYSSLCQIPGLNVAAGQTCDWAESGDGAFDGVLYEAFFEPAAVSERESIFHFTRAVFRK